MQVAQKLHADEIPVHVGRIDCTRFTGVASHFSVKGFPTLMFVNSEKVVEFHGDRTKEDIVDFAKRLRGPAVKPLDSCEDLNSLLEAHKVYFIFFGDSITPEFTEAIETFHSLNWFFHSKMVCPGFSDGFYAIKGMPSIRIANKFNNETDVLSSWMKQQRFPQFVRLTYGNGNMLLSSGKTLIIALVEEYTSVNKLASDKHEQVRDLLEGIANSYDNANGQFVFGWSSQIDMINSIAIKSIEPLPQIVAINSRSLEYYLLEDEHTAENIVKLLNTVTDGTVDWIGGDGYHHKFMRGVYDAFTSLASMYKGNPVLTLLLLGLPLAFFAIIIYTSCCSDILDAREDEEEEPSEGEQHVKTD
jgi:thioredoxin domain-containing protein 10